MQDGVSVKIARRLFGGRFITIACAVVLIPFAARAQDPGRQVLHGHVPNVVARFHLQPTGRLSATKHLNLAIGLPLRNKEVLDDLLQQIYDPASPSFRQYLTPEQFTEMFGPTEQDYQAVIAFAQANGLTVTATHPNRVVLDVSGSAADIEKVFHVTMRTYRHPREDRTFYTPDTEPSIDLPVPILHISGMDDFSLPRPKLKIQPAGQKANATPNSGSGPSGSYRGYDFRAAYVPDTTLTGSGQKVGLLEFDGYFAGDIATYESQAGLPGVTLTNVAVNGGVSHPGGNNIEVALDIEMVISMAPGVSQIIVYEAPNSTSWASILSSMADDNLAKQLSCSWGDSSPGSPDPTSEQIFKQMATQGQSFFNASGDTNAFTSGIPFPSESTNITQVGGTTLTTGAGGSWGSEKVWNSGGGLGSSGGISANYSIPIWQQGINMTTNHGSTTKRNVPDVALTADDVWVTYDNGSSGTVVGTSCAAPLWAGLTALVNQQAVSAGGPVVGFINPAIYTIGKSGNYATDFHDITTGSNTWSGSLTNFYAVAGYDLCTGWGTPAGQSLINDLVGLTSILGITPSTGFSASGPVGGPFNVASQSYTLTNLGTASLNWSIINTSAWLNVSPDSGTLMPGGSSTATASLTSAGSNIVAGTYATTLVFTNTTVHTSQNFQFALSTGQSTVQNGGFETGNFSNWTLSGNTSSASVSSTLKHSGTYGALLGASNSLGYISQTLPTLAGQNYLLSLWLNSPSNPGGHGQQTKTTPNEFLVKWNGSNCFDQVNMPVIGWTNLHFIVTATTSNTLLQFGFRDDYWHLGLDDINVWPIPTPSFRSVTKVTNNSVALTWNSLTSLTYRVEYSTNLARTNWTILSTNTASNFTLTITNSIGTNPQRFYRIRRLP